MTRWMLMIVLCAACHPSTRATDTGLAGDERAAPRAQIPDELAARRAQIIGWLRDYAAAGVYPTDDAGRPLSVFRDARGVRCPMAEVIFRTGHGDIVDAVVRENNAVRLADVHGGPLLDWMLGSGLTRDEIAVVQGIMDVPFTLQIDQPTPELERELVLMAHERIRGRLETAVRALQDNTAHSLEVAAARLPAHRVPVVGAVHGRVLPPTLVGAN